MIEINIDTSQIERAQKLLSHIPGAFERARGAAIARTLQHMKAKAAQLTSAKYYAKSGEIKRTIKTQRRGNNSGVMTSRGPKKSIADYKISPTRQKLGRNQGKLRGAVKREGGLKSLGPAFLVKRAGGRYFPFFRTGKGKYAMHSLISPSMPQIIKNEETVNVMERGAEERFSKRLDHEILQLLGALP